MQLYEKVMIGKRTTYREYTPVEEPETLTDINFTEAECLTAAGALGMMLLMVFERNVPAHKVVARKIKALEASILDLYKGTGAPIDDNIAELMAITWDRTMKSISAGVEI
jgi:hypothetical protein